MNTAAWRDAKRILANPWLSCLHANKIFNTPRVSFFLMLIAALIGQLDINDKQHDEAQEG